MSAVGSSDAIFGELLFYCNGNKVVDCQVDVGQTLLTYLRTKLLLTGSKLGCGEGGCGACTVMVSKYSPKDKTISHIAVNACLTPICAVHGMAVTTVEGIGSTLTKLHPVQERLAKAHGSQCGFCTPGIVMSMYTLLRNRPQPTMEAVESAFEGNLCRCTGYRPILQAYSSFTKGAACCGSRENCCMSSVLNGSTDSNGIATALFDPSAFTTYDPTQEVIFPPELMLMLNERAPSMLKFVGNQVTWFRPITLQQLLELKANHPQAKMVVGNSEVGVEVKFKNQVYPVIIDANHVPELLAIDLTATGVRVGASVSLTSLNEYLKNVINTQPEYKTRIFTAIVEMLRWFAGHQIRNVACLGGNIATGSPISDMNPLLMAAQCSLELQSMTSGSRTVSMDGDFFTGYRRNILKADEIVQAVNIKFTSKNEYFYGYKQSPRREDDIAIVNAGMRVVFEQGTNIVGDCTLAFGGMAATTVLAKRTMDHLVGRKWSDGLLSNVCSLLAEDLPLAPGAPGGMEAYRQSLTLSFFFKFYLTILEQLRLLGVSGSRVPSSFKSATQPYHKKTVQAVQMYQEVPLDQPDSDAVGRPLTHLSALQQVTGEAVYVDDIPSAKSELYLGLVLSKKAHAKLISVDASAALAVDGVHSYVDIKDVPGSNTCGAVVQDDPVFADEEVTSVGQLIGAVVADNQALAQTAAKLVHVKYEELPVIITIEDAIEHNSFYPRKLSIKRGNIEEGFESSDCLLEGEVRIGAQEHFYLETFVTLATPGERGAMEVISSTQAPATTQVFVAKALGVPSHKVVAKVKRIGGGFGGKESKCCIQATAVAVAARKLNRPVRLMLDRDEDMCTTGTRHPYLGRYKVGYTSDGHLRALQMDLYSNCGCSTDLSPGVMERSLFHSDNCYLFPNVTVTGHLCRTNIPSSTAFRGFGAPQAMLVVETIMTDIANKCAISPTRMRELNFYKEGDVTHFGQELKNWTLDRCWEQCLAMSDYDNQRRQVDVFNSENRWRKRGLAIIPTKFGISFTTKFLNQGGALVHIYTDGSVLIAHGGVEMGQGLHIKMIQIASRALGITTDKIHVEETSTSTVPNASPTAASYSSDLNGSAIKNACETLVRRLEPFVQENPKGTWESWVMAAYFNRVSLSSTGYYRTPNLNYNWDTSQGQPFSYFTIGVAVSSVEIDCLTGDHSVLQTDIVMDVGDSVNPAVDIGQIEGAFIQGYGLFVLEDYRMTPTGHLLTRGPGFYKIPGFGDIPSVFNVSLLTRASNPFAICSSKAVGEPPLFLASSVFFAIKDAIQSARSDAGITGLFSLDSPATAERIRMACQDQFTKKFPEPDPKSYVPFFVRP